MGDNSDNNSHDLNDDHDHDYHYDGRLAPRTTAMGRSDKEAKTMQVASSGLFGMSFYYFTIYLLTQPFLGNNYHRQDGLLAPMTTMMTMTGSSDEIGPDDATCIVWALWYVFF